MGEQAYRAMAPNGRAIFKTAPYQGAHEPPDQEYPFRYTTGRTVYHFHTRTKTNRAPQLHDAAPDVWVEMAQSDADGLGVGEGDVVEVKSRRGHPYAPVRISDIRPGTVFAPFHYGYWDTPDPAGADPGQRARAANELTMTEWDPVSKQPVFKTAAVRVTKVADASGPAPAPTTTASRPARPGRIPLTTGGAAAEVSESIAPVEPPAVATKEERS